MVEHLSNVVKALEGLLGLGRKGGDKKRRDGRDNSVWQKVTQVHHLMDKML